MDLDTIQTFGKRMQTPMSSFGTDEKQLKSWNKTKKKNTHKAPIFDPNNAKYRTQCKRDKKDKKLEKATGGLHIEVLRLPLEILSNSTTEQNHHNNFTSAQKSCRSRGSHRFKDWIRSKSREKDTKYRCMNLIQDSPCSNRGKNDNCNQIN